MHIEFHNDMKSKQPRIYLSKPGEKKSCILNSIKTDTVTLTFNLKDFAKLEFDIDKYVYDDYQSKQIIANGYDTIDFLMELYVEGIGWFRINETPQVRYDGYTETKSITAESIQCELQDFNIVGLKINYGSADSVEMMLEGNVTNYPEGLQLPKEQIKFYNPDKPELSLLNILLQDTYKWTIGHVDVSLKNLICRFDIDSSNIYDLLMGEISTAYECLFVFDFENFTINAYSFNDENVLNTGLFKDTNIIIGFRGVENSLAISQNEPIYTVYNVNGSDNLNIYYANFGTNRIENIDHFLTTKYMPQSLIDKYIYWRDYREGRRTEYINYSKEYNAQLDVVSEIKNRVPNTGCQTDWPSIEDNELLASYSNYLALKTGYEAAYTDEHGEFDLNAIQNSIDWPDYYSTITYVIPALENEISIRGLDEQIGGNGNIEYDYNKWETDWTLYGVDELTVKRDEYAEMIASLSAFEQETKPDGDNYTDDYYAEMHQTYVDYISKRDSCQEALTERQSEYTAADNLLKTINENRQAIVTDVDKTNAQFGFTESDFFILWKLYNEIDYVNENMMITSLDTTVTTVDVQNELYLDAVKQLSIDSRPQYNYSSTLDNLLAMYDYRLFHEDFNCGNYIRVMTDDVHQVKLRITSISLNPMNMENDLTIQFSSMITSKFGRSDKVNLLSISSNQKANAITGTSLSTSGGVDITQQMINALLKSPQIKNYSQTLTNNILNLTNGSIIAGSITLDELKAKLAQIDSLEANSAFIQYLESALVISSEIQTDDLYAKLAQINIAQVGDLFAESLQTFTSTVATQTINEAYVVELVAGKLSVGDLAAGDIVLSDNMQILSENGRMIMNGTTLQIKGTDSAGNVYTGIQLGYDTSNNPSLIIRNENGATILDANGIKQDAIADGLIINDMIQNGTLGKEKFNFNVVEADENGAINVSDVVINGEGISAEFVTIKQEIESNIPYSLYISSSNGIRMSNTVTDTLLTAVLYKRDENVTDQYDDQYFIWTRYSSDPEDDINWNEQHAAGTKQLHITRADVYGGAMFSCSFVYNGEVLLTS